MIFRKNPNLERELIGQAVHRAALRAYAEGAKQAAESFTPRGSGAKAGAAAHSLKVVETDDGPSLASTDPFWHLIEFGSVNNPAYAPMRRGVRAAGLRLAERPK